MSLVVNGKTYTFNTGYDMWLWAMLNKPRWFLSEGLTDGGEVSDVVRTTKMKQSK